MDSAVALHWALSKFDPIHPMFIAYGQTAFEAENKAAHAVATNAASLFPDTVRELTWVNLPAHVFASQSSILGRSPIQHYQTVEDAVAGTPTDTSYIPIRNAIFATLAAHHLLALHPDGGAVITGIRSRPEPNAPAGFPDCTKEFARAMTNALSVASGKRVDITDPLNLYAPSREKTIRLAIALPGGYKALGLTVSCFHGRPRPCGMCIPCKRRAQAFEQVGVIDPAL